MSKTKCAMPHREPATPMRDPALASGPVHLRRNYAPLRPAAAGPTAAADDGHAEGRPTETGDQNMCIDGRKVHGARVPAATSATSGPADRPPPRIAPACRQENVDYPQSKGDTHRPIAEVERGSACDLDP